jgi:hypothetical protein
MWISKEKYDAYKHYLDKNSYYLDQCCSYVNEITELKKENTKLKESVNNKIMIFECDGSIINTNDDLNSIRARIVEQLAEPDKVLIVPPYVKYIGVFDKTKNIDLREKK